MGRYSINLRDAIFSLSDALDLVGVTHIHHGKRVAYMAAEIGCAAGWDKKWLDRTYLASILHDCGVSQTRVHKRLRQFEWEKEADHCTLGAAMLALCPMLADLAPLVLHHHTHWEVLRKLPISAEDRLIANCIHLADRADVLTLASLVDQPDILLGRNATRERIASKRGDWFDGELVDAFLSVSLSEAFWLSMEGGRTTGYAPKWIAHDQEKSLEFDELRSLVRVFAQIVDAKSPFTKEHSDGVARLARYLGKKLGLSERSCELLELAGLLHDLGKLRVPDEILEKNGQLTTAEFAQMQRHSFDTYEVLKGVKGFEEVALWAGQHHEKIDGSGYPYHVATSRLALEARILAVADIFQALAADRPYRKAMPVTKIVEILREQAASGKLDFTVAECVAAHIDECHSEATRHELALNIDPV